MFHSTYDGGRASACPDRDFSIPSRATSGIVEDMYRFGNGVVVRVLGMNDPVQTKLTSPPAAGYILSQESLTSRLLANGRLPRGQITLIPTI